MARIPEDGHYERYLQYCRYNNPKWFALPEDWKCPACDRTKKETFVFMYVSRKKSYSWIAGLNAGMCVTCGNLHHHFRKKYKLADWYQFTCHQLRQAILSAEPHGDVHVDFSKLKEIYDEEMERQQLSAMEAGDYEMEGANA